jgi:hypothetical protein
MYLKFESLPDHSRVWVYQSTRAFADSEKTQLTEGLTALCDQWSAHGAPLHTSFTIAFDQFVIMAVDELQHGASGCSIDGSVRYLKSLQSALGLDFFDRSGIAFLEKGKVKVHPMTDLKSLFGEQALSAGTITFNNLVNTKAEWSSQWQVTVKNSWMARFLPKMTVEG